MPLYWGHFLEIGMSEFKKITNPPGGVIVWFIIAMELITFIAGIYFFFAYKHTHLNLFLAEQQKLNLNFAILNTMFLVTSGYLVALALNELKQKNKLQCRKYLISGIVVGSFFIFLKLFEYHEKLNQGLDSSYNAFFTFYWFLTFFHFAHVFFALLILSYLYFSLKKDQANEVAQLEVGASLWHMCDLIWVLLFPTLFFIR